MTIDATHRLAGSRTLRYDTRTGHLRQLRARLTIMSGSKAGQSRLVESSVILGTDDEVCDLVVDDRAVSRRHVEVSAVEGGARVVDLRSTNGTWMRGLKISDVMVDVANPARFRIGETELELSVVEDDLGPSGERDTFDTLRSRSPVMQRFFGTLAKVAPSATTVLLQGETGTGKDVVARALHQVSGRQGPFVVFDCGATPENLIESTLFGHVRGAFSGASEDRNGLALEADRGTLFLDEVGELPLAMQPRLLRLLETRTVLAVGGTIPQQLNVRFVAATHRDLEEMVAAGNFRKDLYFRLSVLQVTVPPLRERLEDVVPLARTFAAERGGDVGLSAALEAQMIEYLWPGNVRELRNFVERAMSGLPVQTEPNRTEELPFKEAKNRLFESFTRAYITRLAAVHQGNITRMAEAAGIARVHLHRLLKQFDL